ncbi:MAG: HEAT repeat domain-containing protein [Planctomycetota bacterium]|nr:HEAT repeat domain-containing protein [Planctomycetota bacterium]
MKSSTLRMVCYGVFSILLGVCWEPLSAQTETIQTGPVTENRFPPLQVPEGFRSTLFACDPLMEYPSTLARGPRLGTVFVAQDYLTGLGIEIVKRDEIRFLEDQDGDGYADRTTCYASEFNSIQGITYHDGVVYVVHSPLLTALRDTNGDGIADQRQDLLNGLGLAPEQNPPRLHCGNGIVMGHDNWLYIALGDHGCRVRRPEGDWLILEGGGILRCRADGRDLHIFSRGLRNIYDVVLDENINVFVRDNENDGGDYKIRVYHSIFGSDHGYPYDYLERPEVTMQPLADLGLGSSAGGTSYLETAFPPDYQGNLFFCEWGRSVVRYPRESKGSGFQPMQEFEFAVASETDPYGFKPTDIVVDWDGSLLISDWADGQRPRRGRGRIYRIFHGDTGSTAERTTDSLSSLVSDLNEESYLKRHHAQTRLQHLGKSISTEALWHSMLKEKLERRAKSHVVWLLAERGDPYSANILWEFAEKDQDPSVQAQAVRALADWHDPVFVDDRLDSKRCDERIAERIARIGVGADAVVILEVVQALGRLHWPETVSWLRSHLPVTDRALDHATMQTMRRMDHWPSVMTLLDQPTSSGLRKLALRAVTDQFLPKVVDGTITRLEKETSISRQQQYVEVLSRVYRKPGAWKYWGYRPAPRSPGKVVWEGTESIEQVMDQMLRHASLEIRHDTLIRMQRENIPAHRETLYEWLRDDHAERRITGILEVLRSRADQKDFPLLAMITVEDRFATSNRIDALGILRMAPLGVTEAMLLELAGLIEEPQVLTPLLRLLGEHDGQASRMFLLDQLDHPVAEIRLTAIDVLAKRGVKESAEQVHKMLSDADLRVRRAAAAALGDLRVFTARDKLLAMLEESDLILRHHTLRSLLILGDNRAIPVALDGLRDRETRLVSLAYLAEFGDLRYLQVVLERVGQDRSKETLVAVTRALVLWRESCIKDGDWSSVRIVSRALSSLQGESGTLLCWATHEISEKKESLFRIDRLFRHDHKEVFVEPSDWKTVVADKQEVPPVFSGDRNVRKSSRRIWTTDVSITKESIVEIMALIPSSTRVWVNKKQVHPGVSDRDDSLQSVRFFAYFSSGVNRLVLELPAQLDNQWHMAFRQLSPAVDRERLTQEALTGSGDVVRGRSLFSDTDKSLCIRCHRLSGKGGEIGPDLTGVGSRFSRIHLIESILNPSRTIAPSYGSVLVTLSDGKVYVGVPVSETDSAISFGDQKGEIRVVQRSEIESIIPQSQSLMPEGMEKKWTDQEFVDLIAFLLSLKENKDRNSETQK